MHPYVSGQQSVLRNSAVAQSIIVTPSVAADLNIPPLDVAARLNFPAELAIRLIDDEEGNARWVSAERLAGAQYSRYQPPFHPASRLWKDVWRAEIARRRAEMHAAREKEESMRASMGKQDQGPTLPASTLGTREEQRHDTIVVSINDSTMQSHKSDAEFPATAIPRTSRKSKYLTAADNAKKESTTKSATKQASSVADAPATPSEHKPEEVEARPGIMRPINRARIADRAKDEDIDADQSIENETGKGVREDGSAGSNVEDMSAGHPGMANSVERVEGDSNDDGATTTGARHCSYIKIMPHGLTAEEVAEFAPID